ALRLSIMCVNNLLGLTVCPARLLRCSAATSRAFSVAPPLPSGSWRSLTVRSNAPPGRAPRCCRNSSSTAQGHKMLGRWKPSVCCSTSGHIT
ncbi:hypothetical protein XENOCAPTIV_008870, partial [Xenoophorus captivus]